MSDQKLSSKTVEETCNKVFSAGPIRSIAALATRPPQFLSFHAKLRIVVLITSLSLLMAVAMGGV